jgi:hypothetical protein
VDAGEGDDRVWTRSGNDHVLGGDEQDWLDGEASDDRLEGGAGDDRLEGVDGDDHLDGGAGDDRLVGGEGDDRVVTGTGTGTGTARRVVLGDGWGNAVLTFPMGETLTLQGVPPSSLTGAQNLRRAGIPCFTAGTPIATPTGLEAVERVRAGDLVLTRDDGPQPVRWVSMRRLGPADLADERLRPIEVGAGVLGNDGPLLVSRQHGLLVRTGGEERLVRSVTYVHLMFDRHQVILGGGARSESFYPGSGRSWPRAPPWPNSGSSSPRPDRPRPARRPTAPRTAPTPAGATCRPASRPAARPQPEGRGPPDDRREVRTGVARLASRHGLRFSRVRKARGTNPPRRRGTHWLTSARPRPSSPSIACRRAMMAARSS